MGTSFAPSLLTEIDSAPLWIAFARLGTYTDGTLAGAWWFNHELEYFEPTFDPAKHLKPLVRASDEASSPISSIQSFAVPRRVLEPDQTQGYIFRAEPGGEASAAVPVKLYSRVELVLHSAADPALK